MDLTTIYCSNLKSNLVIDIFDSAVNKPEKHYQAHLIRNPVKFISITGLSFDFFYLVPFLAK